jgi:hypothetical protein
LPRDNHRVRGGGACFEGPVVEPSVAVTRR